MIVILEGPDGSGKTTAAQHAVQAGYAVVHHGPPKPDEDVFRTYLEALLTCPPNTVFDRLFHGERVYGPLLRGESQLTRGQVAYLEQVAAGRGAVVVRCDAAPEVLVARGDPLYQRVNPERLQNAYSDVWKDSLLTHVDYRSDLEESRKVWERCGWVSRPDANPAWGIGVPGHLVLVGERFSEGVTLPLRGAAAWREPPFCYFRPFSGAASRDWLFEALASCSEYDPQGTYLTNAFKDALTTGRSRNALRAELEGAERVVALGRDAERELQAAGQPYEAAVEHPQFAKRFHHQAGPRGYAKKLRSALWS